MFDTPALLLAILGAQREKVGDVLRIEPGREWIYEGSLATASSGKPDTRGRFRIRLRCLALERTAEGEIEIALGQEIEPGTWAYRPGEEWKELPTKAYEGVVFLTLGPDFRLKRSEGSREWPHEATPYLEFAPFPISTAPVKDGGRAEVKGAFDVMHLDSFPGVEVWTAEASDRGVRVSCTPKTLPVREEEGEEESRTLDRFQHSWLLDASAGVAREIERSWRTAARHETPPRTDEASVSLRLVEVREAEGETYRARRVELGARRRAFAAARDLEERIGEKGADLEALRKEVRDFEASLEDSPWRTLAGDVRQAIVTQEHAREFEEAERRTRERLVGRPAPDFTGTDLAGNEVALSNLRGKVVLLNFWATW